MSGHADRQERLELGVGERGLDALLVTNLVNVRYLTGFTGTSGACVIGSGTRLFVTDFRYVDQAAAQVEGFERSRARESLLGEVAEHLSGRVGFDDEQLTVAAHSRLSTLLADRAELVAAGGLVEELRAVKDPAELRSIREAAALTDDVYEWLCLQGLVGRTEREVALALERELRDRGAEDVSFPPIVAGGAHGALPHASPRAEPIPTDTLVIVDMGCVLDGYSSDCTRTFATGPLDGEAADVYDLVRDAQERALAAVLPGAGCRDVDRVARDVLEHAGQGERFGHGLGHGVGLEVHEAPRLSPSGVGELAEGNVVTVEPGVYVPGSFGVRIEDLVAVGAGAPEILSRFPKELVTLDS